MNYHRLGPDYFRDAKSPAEARAKIRAELIHYQALADARKEATELANAVFNQNPMRPENLAATAKQKGLTVHTTAPFASDFGPEELGPVEGFTKAAFALTPDEPFAEPIVGPNAVYVMALLKRLPSEIPPFDEIHDRVTADFRHRQAVLLARQAGTNFVHNLTSELAGSQDFASVCIGAGLHPVLLPPFSLSTQRLPELDDHADLNQLKQAAFTTPLGQVSGFHETSDGGFTLYVQSRLPLDQTAMNAGFPQFINALRYQRQREAFNDWLQREANMELRDTPLFQGRTLRAAPQNKS
jgi:hypothetical protein